MKLLIKKFTAKFGYQTKKKQIIILSDDWGSVRLKSLQDRESLRRKGIDVNTNRFDQYDCLESNKDLEDLFEILTKHKDHLGNHPCITAVTNVVNPNFKKIKDSGFKEYHFETNVETYLRYNNSDRVLDLTKEGIANKIFTPQSHVREHVQINWWMTELQNPESMARHVFQEEFFFLGKKHLLNQKLNGLGASLNCVYEEDFNFAPKIVNSALQIFKEIYGYNVNYICPPSQYYPENIDPILSNHQVQWLDVARMQKVARLHKKPKQNFRILGQKTKSNFRYLVRNAVYETNFTKYDDGVNSCMKDIQEAFDCKQPAIISNHRASFVGGIEKKNREKGLKSIDQLFSKILNQWPDVEFINIQDL